MMFIFLYIFVYFSKSSRVHPIVTIQVSAFSFQLDLDLGTSRPFHQGQLPRSNMKKRCTPNAGASLPLYSDNFFNQDFADGHPTPYPEKHSHCFRSDPLGNIKADSIIFPTRISSPLRKFLVFKRLV